MKRFVNNYATARNRNQHGISLLTKGKSLHRRKMEKWDGEGDFLEFDQLSPQAQEMLDRLSADYGRHVNSDT